MQVNKIIHGDSLEVLKTLPDNSVDCVITSPPYWGLRDYGNAGQIGLEKTPEEYVAKMVEVFREVRRVLKKEGTTWLNLGDSYCSHFIGPWGKPGGFQGKAMENNPNYNSSYPRAKRDLPNGLKNKDLVGIPWRVAFALQADGWYLRQDIIWAKPNPMPESVTDRCTKSHEYIFLLTRNPKYYFDNEAIKEKAVIEEQRPSGVARDRMFDYDSKEKAMGKRMSGGPIGGVQKARAFGAKEQLGTYGQDVGNVFIDNGLRNKRSVWTVNTHPYSGAHFATFPEKLIEPMVLAGCPQFVCNKCGKAREKIFEREAHNYKSREDRQTATGGAISGGVGKNFPDVVVTEKGLTDCGCNAGFSGGVVLDIFMGAGTTAVVAKNLGRNYLGIELNLAYIEIANKRIDTTTGNLFTWQHSN